MKNFINAALIIFFIFINIIQSDADDTDLFLAQIPPDALILLDQSGSMGWTPAGSTMYVAEIVGTNDCDIDGPFYPTSGTGHTHGCTGLSYTSGGPIYGDSESCSGPFYKTSGSGYGTDCSRIGIAKRSVFNLLDDNKDTVIDGRDETSLGIRLAYMRFYTPPPPPTLSGDDTANDYNSGSIRLGRKNTSGCTESSLTADALVLGSSFADIYGRVNCESAYSGTPLASSLNEAKLYLDAHKAGDNAGACRKKFVILVTDGADTYACSGDGSETLTSQYKRRRESVAKTKALLEAGYYVFVVGFGADMAHYLKNTLNWMAHFGGTDNPLAPNSGDINGYNPAAVSSCEVTSYTSHNLGEGDHYFATSKDPGEATLSGYAFFSENPSQLTNALKTIKKYIQEKAYSLTSAAIPLVRLIDKDVVYITSVETPSWNGNLKSYQLNEDGTLPVDPVTKLINVNPVWDAGVILNQKNPDDRNIYTYLGSAGREEFKLTNSNLTKEALGVPDDINRNKLINHVRGIDAYDLNGNGNTTELREWKLGDIFHSNPVIIGEPSRFFIDEGFSGVGGFYQANKDRTRVIFVGANDGMLHAFNASTGDEVWGFITNSLLKNLLSMVSTHTYYVDSSPKVADVWFDSNGDNIKSAGEWRTLLVCGLRKGGQTYFALNITDTLNPIYLWEFPKPTDSATLAKVGQSWSEPAIGRVKIESGSNLVEKWVAFIGGGFDYANNVGKVFYVIDINTGDIIKEFYGLSGMDYSLTASPIVVDTNLDGYVDKVYMGDLGGQMWVFDVSFDETTKKSDSQWTGKRLFTAPVSISEKHRIYYPTAVAFDRYRNPWVYFGTGDREYPKDDSNPAERFYAVKDDGKGTDGSGTYPLTETNLLDVTSLNTFDPTSLKGWYIRLAKSTGRLEKVLAKPSVFNRLVYFTTYTYTGETNPCTVAGEGRLYMVEYLSGGGALTVDDLNDLAGTPFSRSTDIGAGIPSPPTISVNLKGKASVNVGTTSNQILSEEIFSPGKLKEIIYWREVIP
jgi:type IV pilus assembly protein PilY1